MRKGFPFPWLVVVWVIWFPGSPIGFAQSPVLDSLWKAWQDPSNADTLRLEAFDKIIWSKYLYNQPDSAFLLAQQAYDFAGKRDLKKFMGFALNAQGISWRLRGDYPKALEYYTRCLEIREEMGDMKRVAGSLNNIGLIYSFLDQHTKALEFYKRSLKIYEDIGDKPESAYVLNNIGILYAGHKDKSRALEYFERSRAISEEIGDKKGVADCLNNIGNNYKDQGKYDEALKRYELGLLTYQEIGEKKGTADCLINIGHTKRAQGHLEEAKTNYEKSLQGYLEIGDKYGIVNCYIGLGRAYSDQSRFQAAVIECHKAYALAKEIESISTQRDACKCLYDANKALGNTEQALVFHERMLDLTDSLQTEETNQQLERMEFQKQILADSLQQEEEKLRIRIENEKQLARESRRRNFAIAGGGFFILLAAGLFHRVRYIRKSKAVIEKERDRSDHLLLNILPSEIAEELKEHGRSVAREFDCVSILFTDFRNFTQTSERMSAQKLVEEIHTCFEAFDAICEEYGIEKIKTIGDSYMAAGGLPVPSDESVKRTVLAGIAMAAFILKRKKVQEAAGHTPFEMRVGIHTGPVVAGIVGVKKFQYDIWGDVVNTASRMETACEIGRVNISQDTYRYIQHDPLFKFESRGKIQTKGKGELEMYFVTLA